MEKKLYKKMFTMSFDDGTIQDRRFINLIDKYNLKCTFNLNSGFFGQVHNIVHDGIQVCHDEVLPSEVNELYKNHEIAVHTVNHPNLLDCTRGEIIREVNVDYECLTELSGKIIIGMAYPGGPFYNDFVIETIQKNTPIRYARTTNSSKTFDLPDNFMEWYPTCHQNDEEIMMLAEEFVNIEPQKDMLFYLWGHSFEFDKFNSWDNFENFCKFISGRSDINYMTNNEVYHYLTTLQTK